MSGKIIQIERDIQEKNKKTLPNGGGFQYRSLIIPVSVIIAIIIWELAARFGQFPAFILPSPTRVWNRLLEVLQNGTLIKHTIYTLSEVLAGLAIGVLVATVLGYFLAKSPVVERLLSPYIVASQSVPIVAIAPLLVIWFGPGIISKVLICALIVFLQVQHHNSPPYTI